MDDVDPSHLRIDALAHDLNNVLQTIGHAAALITAPDHAPIAAMIARNVEQARRIIDGAREPERPVHLAGAVRHAAEFVDDFARVTGGPTLSFDIDIPGSVRLRARPATIERTCTNLFLNAAEAARRADRTAVRVEVRAFTEGGDALITISDDGPGMEPALLDRIFDTGYAAAGGSGLGLHIVASAVRAAGGNVHAANRREGGVEFTLRLPADSLAASA